MSYKGYRDKEKRQKYMHDLNQGWRSTHRTEYNAQQRAYYRGRMARLGKSVREGAKLGTRKFGRVFEVLGCLLLDAIPSPDSRYDAIKNGHSIEIKVRHKRRRGGWKFPKNVGFEADLYLFFCLDSEDRIVKAYLLPGKAFTKSIELWSTGKYDRYLVTAS